MEESYRKYICSICRRTTKENCMKDFTYTEDNVFVFKCLNFRRSKIKPSKEKEIEQYLDNKNAPIN